MPIIPILERTKKVLISALFSSSQTYIQLRVRGKCDKLFTLIVYLYLRKNRKEEKKGKVLRSLQKGLMYCISFL